MPIYEYKCPKCQKVFEEWLKVSEVHESAACPACGAESRHIISNTAFVLKGGGWYVTDYGYRKNKPEESASSDTNAASASASDSAKKAESPAASPAPATTPAAPASSNSKPSPCAAV